MSSDLILNTLSVKTSHYILGGVALVTALSWNETIKKTINKCIPTPSDQLQANVIYSIVITLLLVVLIYLLPGTESEFPKKTREKIKEIKYKQYLDGKISTLERNVVSLSQENRSLRENLRPRVIF